MGIIGYDDLAEYILGHYSPGSRVVEVGIGRHPDIAELLKNTYDFTCTDVTPEGPENLNYVRDDIFRPDLSLYEGASLIYSIRPPVDMQDSIAMIANRVGADLLIRPFSSEKTDLSRYFSEFRCVNYKRAVFFLYRNKK
ncbi:UPF0146 family protein [Methanocella sp. MCL-LM]|uniref:UPF0146 family protein n=1 Tax=Methanocella sp. MCL-LM TaxID=3412035 RepID=UPI003C70DFA7